MTNFNFTLDIPKIMGSDILIYNATINSFRCNGSFENFLTHYNDNLECFFNKIKIKIDDDEFLLTLKYKTMLISEVKAVFDEVYKNRVDELKFTITEPKFDDMSDLEKGIYKFIYEYGDKIAGYNAIAGLNLTEIAKLKEAFKNFNNQEKNLINKELKRG